MLHTTTIKIIITIHNKEEKEEVEWVKEPNKNNDTMK